MTKFCVPDVIENIKLENVRNVKVLNLVPKTNEKRHKEWHETCKCKCIFHVNVF